MVSTSISYDESTGQWFISDDLQKKVNELLAIHRRPISLMEFYEFIAESIPDKDAREDFLRHVKSDGPWIQQCGFIPNDELRLKTDDLTVLHFNCDKI